ncbi:hypothetical protein PDIDSM_6505 [Penicillium digitatum]|nr:hypothetical protein PDIDSM_6505 [Penicillium digitatum]
METEETEGLTALPLASPIKEATPTFSEETEGLSVPLTTSTAIKQMSTSIEESKQLQVLISPSLVIEPMSLSQPNPGCLEEPNQQTDKPNSQPVVEWVVPDGQLLLASQVLLENNWPRLLYHEKRWNGNPRVPEYWETHYLMHALDSEDWMRVHLIPLSLVGFTLEDTVEVPSTFAHELHLLTPKPPHYMSSLIHHLLQLPIDHNSRIRVEKDLLGFISTYILKDGPANTTVWTYLNDQDSDKDYQKKVEEGVRFMKTWDWGKIEERYLAMAECAVRDCRYINSLTDVHEERHTP